MMNRGVWVGCSVVLILTVIMIMHFIFVDYYFYYYFKLVFFIFIRYTSKRKILNQLNNSWARIMIRWKVGLPMAAHPWGHGAERQLRDRTTRGGSPEALLNCLISAAAWRSLEFSLLAEQDSVWTGRAFQAQTHQDETPSCILWTGRASFCGNQKLGFSWIRGVLKLNGLTER